MKLFLFLCAGLIAGIYSFVNATETNVFFPVHPEGRTGNLPPEPEPTPELEPSGGGGGGNIVPVLTSGFVFPTAEISTGTVTTIDIVVPPKTIVGTTNDMLDAYTRAKQYNIASQSSYEEEDMYTPLTRVELARMIVKFSAHTDKEIRDNTPCKATPYKDTDDLTDDELGYIIQACELGMMGRKAGRLELLEFFHPEGTVTRAEFATVLSRFLYGDKYKNTTTPESRYVRHLLAMHDKGFLRKIDEPFMQERQGYVMIVLQRIAASFNTL